MKETWKPIDDFPWYEVSSFGRVRSIDRKVPGKLGSMRTVPGKMLKQYVESGRYMCVYLTNHKAAKVHVLVAEAFICKRPQGKNVNHKNGVTTDNCVDNLEWVTHSENVRHSFNVLGRKAGHQGLTGSLSPFSKPVEAFDLVTGEIKHEFPSSMEAHRLGGFSQSCVNACCRGERVTHRKLGWRFKEAS